MNHEENTMEQRNEPEPDIVALFNAVNDAGYGYSSEWIGDFDDRENMLAKFTVRKGKRKVGEYYAAKPSLAAAKACAALCIVVRTVVDVPLPFEAAS